MHKFVSLLFFLVVIVACSNSESNSSDSVDPSEILIIDFIEDADTSATDTSDISDSSEAIPTDTTEADTIAEGPTQSINGMIFVKGGSVTIGTNDKSFKTNERPAMKVLLDYDFYMDIHEVTCGDYGKVWICSFFNSGLMNNHIHYRLSLNISFFHAKWYTIEV